MSQTAESKQQERCLSKKTKQSGSKHAMAWDFKIWWQYVAQKNLKIRNSITYYNLLKCLTV